MITEKRPIPIGVDDFKKMRENNYCYIDKTLLISEILKSGSEVSLFTRPRRFGKTLNMSMLRYFFDCNCPSSKTLFEGLKISKDYPEFCLEHMNKYPLVYISFKDISYENKESFLRKLNNHIADICVPFRYLLNSESTTPEQKDWFSLLLKGKADEELLRISLKRLTLLLFQYHGDTKSFQKYFSEVVLQVMSYHDFANQPENAFHCFTAGFLSWLSHKYDVRSNRETGEGRAGIWLLPKNTKLPGYIFELKALKPAKKVKTISMASINSKLNAALKQIEEKNNYVVEFKARKIKKITKIAMVFYKKKVWFKEAK